MTDIKKIYFQLCTLSVFRSLLSHPLFAHFMAYNETDDIAKKRMEYGAFVSEIYSLGGNLTRAVKKLVLENENIYVRLLGAGKVINGDIEKSAIYELKYISMLASLSYKTFELDMKATDFMPEYSYEGIDLASEYKARLTDISKYGYGIFASNAMFSVSENGEIEPIRSADPISLDDFIGYEYERGKVIANTEAFIASRPAANVLLYGDAGTGKSSSVKAIVNKYFTEGLRLIEIRKNQLLMLPKIMGNISDNPLKFIIFIDDLSFNQNDDSFSMLKATLEGSACAKAKNAVIYATSNRRHIVKESFSERQGDEVHINDTLQETLSLSERFGLTVLFAKPEKKLYLDIVRELASRHGIENSDELLRGAEEFALRRGNRSARAAEQYIDSLI